MDLTPEEEREMELRPIPSAPISDENFQLRKGIAIKLQDFCLKIWPATPEMLEIYNAAPMWKFYKDGPCVLRVYCACLICGCPKGTKCPMPDGPCTTGHIKGVHTASAHINSTNLSAGRPVSKLIHYDKWPADDEFFIRNFSNSPAAFLDPCGFAMFFQ